MTTEQWELGGLELDRPALAPWILQPWRVEARQGEVRWAIGHRPEGKFAVVPSRSTLIAFSRLARASDNRIGEFIRRWGPLRIDARPVGYWPRGDMEAVPSPRRFGGDPVFAEPTDSYRRAAAVVGALLDCASSLIEPNRMADPDRWLVFSPAVPASARQGARLAAHYATRLIHDWGAFPAVEDVLGEPGRFRVSVAADSQLRGALAAQLVRALSRGEPFGWCDVQGCDEPGIRRSRRRWYCLEHDTAQSKAAERQRRHRARTHNRTQAPAESTD